MPIPEIPRKRRKRILLGIVLVVVVVFIVWQALVYAGVALSGFPWVSSSDWQAVFLANNQVYFGHLSSAGRDYAVLKDIFYLSVAQPNQPLQQGASVPGPTLNLVKLGGELHGPQDTMYIPNNQIMFWENLKKDSQVVKAIDAFYASQPKQ